MIERVFAVLKSQFPILRLPRGYSLTTQWDIVIAYCVLHNRIVMHGVGDPILETISIANASRIDPPLTRARNTTTVPRWNRDTWLAFRDSIAEHMCVEYEQQQQRNQQ